MDFNLSSYFNAFDVDKDYQIEFSDVDSKLDAITDSLANNPESLNYNQELLEDLVELTHGFRVLEEKKRHQLAYLITSSLNAVGQSYDNVIQAGDFLDNVDTIKSTLERYGYLIFVLLKYLGKEDFSQVGNARSQKAVPREVLARWKSNCTEVENGLTAVITILNLDLSKVFVTTPERDSFVELFSRPIINLMESPERMKLVPIKLLIFKALCIAVTKHKHGSMLQHSIIQCLTYYAHLPQYMAGLLHTLTEKYDYMVLTEEILREISQTHFNSNDTNGPKAVSEFLIKLSELSPRLILRQMTSISQLLDNSNQTLRCSVVEACGNIVVDILKNSTKDQGEDEDADYYRHQVVKLLNLLEERFLDQNPYVRTKAFQALSKVADLKVKLTERRQKMMMLAVRSLEDRSTLVRRNAIKLMSKLILNHQFQGSHGTQLALTFWKRKLDDAEAELMKYIPADAQPRTEQSDSSGVEDNGNELDKVEQEEDSNEREETIKEGEPIMDIDKENVSEEGEGEGDIVANTSSFNDNLPDATVLARVKLTTNYYKDAVDFVEAVHHGTEVISGLLFSKNRNEAIDAMDFLVLADAYGIENSHIGIRKMLHLVWMKGSSDEGKSVPAHLIDCYKSLFLIAPASASKIEKATYIAKNLIGLTLKASVADLASLEKLLGLMYAAMMINFEVINVLWQIYNLNDRSEEVRKQKRGAIIILGMLSLEDNQIAVKGFDSLLNIGLGEEGKDDLILGRYTCIALQRVISADAKKNSTVVKIPREEEAIAKFKQILIDYNENPEWYSISEEAIDAIFQLSSEPDRVCSDVIKSKAIAVFDDSKASVENPGIALSQLLFIAGHVAIKTIVFLEKLEGQFKKKKHEAESKKGTGISNNGGAGGAGSAAAASGGAADTQEEANEENELEMIGGTSEDDFADAVVHVKERELLYGDYSLLGRFGPLVKEICAHPKQFPNLRLQRSAVLCLAKLMCVSSIYCEENLPLLLQIMEKSDDPVTRCNCVLGLGDVAVCFNNIVDENTEYIYSRLTDENIMVQRTCLMTVTFLILAGQVKVKGQLSSMAKCLENPDQSISDMCRLFFAELATKDNAIYNGFIDIFSGLSNDQTLAKDEMKRIIRFLVGFIDKEKHQKQLAEKLLARLPKCQSENQWQDVAFVLQTIPYKNDAITAALEEGFTLVSAKH
ncbi:Non-SMC subunit of the condensin complex, putative [Candida dubliniensis CD36]|uniref:Condensin complex subunit 1 n=1 Tax=Candida dubliniensis (strain CD36 / ATCC MYA-646 / CBS 7987 / NCPF 3949 / NRRL Y-17841) TaxID=573826 RepID=B9WC33_CANDC|nr:Non-SMC subunit of the condensin complex, putative [Candida dubliniensis CD36]CAX43955.1 Non-SMC subunit of the condensin complex, putative [Candida dubliniensis CD36]